VVVVVVVLLSSLRALSERFSDECAWDLDNDRDTDRQESLPRRGLPGLSISVLLGVVAAVAVVAVAVVVVVVIVVDLVGVLVEWEIRFY